MRHTLFIISILLACYTATAQKKSKTDYLIELQTAKGQIHLILFDETPLHKANFIKLVKSGFYNDLLFHRVINEFMIQGGDPLSKSAKKGAQLGMGGDELDKIPFEFNTTRVHTRGALAAARDGNPEKKSSGCQFYIVTGKKYPVDQLESMAQRTGMKYSSEQTKAYAEIGGTPFLDKNYTVFGQVIAGIEVAEAIQKTLTDGNNRPEEDIKMTVTAQRIKKKKLEKRYHLHLN